jgi:hypothetical protein
MEGGGGGLLTGMDVIASQRVEGDGLVVVMYSGVKL